MICKVRNKLFFFKINISLAIEKYLISLLQCSYKMFIGNDKKTHFEKDYWPSKKSLISPDYSCGNYILVVSYDDIL